MTSKVEGATTPSRYSATPRMSAPMPSPADEALLAEDLREPPCLFADRPGDEFRPAAGGRGGEPAYTERVRSREGVPRRHAEGRRSKLPDRLTGRLHDRGQGSVPGHVRAELDREGRGHRDGHHALQSAL